MDNPLKNLEKYNIVLASHSPRRRELLGLLDVKFKLADIIEVDEVVPDGIPALDVPAYLCQLKAEAYTNVLKDNDLYITADTVVLLGDEILGKPKDEDDARRMLHEMSRRVHKVVTGVCVFTRGRREVFSTVTDVEFGPLTDSEIDYYLANYRPYDKAGAYGIQEWIGATAIKGVVGSFYNVMGLPVHALWQVLTTF